MRTPWSLAALLTVGFASLGCGGQGGAPTRPSGPRPGPPGRATGADGPAPAPWSLDLAGRGYPDRPAAGQVHGQEFTPDQVKLEGSVLRFRQGKEFFADREVQVFLFADPESLAQGLHVEARADAQVGSQVPHVHLAWMEAGGGVPKTEIFDSKYAMKLDLGKADGSKLPGKVYVCLPDAQHSFLAGTFTADAPDLVGAKIHGRVLLKGAGDRQLAVGYVGSAANGEVKSCYAGTKVNPGFSVSSSGTRLAFDDKGGCTYRHLGVPPGTYLVFAVLDDRALGWKWVEVRGEKDLTVDLAVDQEGLGTLEVQLPAGSKEHRVNLVPLDAAGKLPALKAPAATVASQLQAFVRGLGAAAKAGEDRVSFPGLKAGAYRVLAGPASADATVQPRQTVKVKLPAKRP
jgi:hypothetical protein